MNASLVILACERELKRIEKERIQRREDEIQKQMKLKVGPFWSRRFKMREEAIKDINLYISDWSIDARHSMNIFIRDIKNLRDVAILSVDDYVYVDNSNEYILQVLLRSKKDKIV